MKAQIIPTVFAENKRDFEEKFEKALELSNKIQIDFMDGKFVKTKSINLSEMSNLKNYKGKIFEAHLMVFHPEKYIKELGKRGFKKIIFHYEAVKENEIKNIVNSIKKLKMIPFIALNPETEINEITNFINIVKGVLIMGVNPGKEGQKFIEKTYQKIISLRKISKNLDIEVDGGVNDRNVRKIVLAGANLINSGSFLYNSKNPKLLLDSLN